MLPMKQVTAKEARGQLGRVMEDSQHEPVRIMKNGRPYSVVVSATQYEQLEMIEDAYWAKRAVEAEKDGFIGVKESKTLIQKLLNA